MTAKVGEKDLKFSNYNSFENKTLSKKRELEIAKSFYPFILPKPNCNPCFCPPPKKLKLEEKFVQKKNMATCPFILPPFSYKSVPTVSKETSKYSEIRMLGKGTQGVVFLAKDRAERRLVAIKKITTQTFPSEIKFLEELRNCPHGVQMIEHFKDGKKHHIVTEYLPGVLNQKPLTLSLSDIISIARQYLEFLLHLEQNNTLHGDLKPANSSWDFQSRCLTIFDYGLSSKLGENSALIQTTVYRSPEVILKGPRTTSTDLWSLGCILYELFTGEILFSGSSSFGIYNSFSHLELIAGYLGLPEKSFLQKCDRAQFYYDIKIGDNGQTAISLKSSSNLTTPHWAEYMLQVGATRRWNLNQVHQLIQLIGGMLRYENREPISKLLDSPLFHEDLRFFLPPDLPAGSKFFLRGYSDFMSDAMVIEDQHRNDKKCFHLRRDPNDQYFAILEYLGNRASYCLSLKDSERLDLTNGSLLSVEKIAASAQDIFEKTIPQDHPDQKDGFSHINTDIFLNLS